MSDERPESLAAQAASWVPPWERAPRPPDPEYAAKVRAGENDDEPDVDDDDDFDPAFEGADPAPGDGVPAELPPFPEEVGGPPTVDAPREVPGEVELEPTDVGIGPEVPLPGAIEEAAEHEIGESPLVDAPLDGDDAGDVFDVAADDDVTDDAEVDLPFEEQVPGPEEDDDPDAVDSPAARAEAPAATRGASPAVGAAASDATRSTGPAAGADASDVEPDGTRGTGPAGQAEVADPESGVARVTGEGPDDQAAASGGARVIGVGAAGQVEAAGGDPGVVHVTASQAGATDADSDVAHITTTGPASALSDSTAEASREAGEQLGASREAGEPDRPASDGVAAEPAGLTAADAAARGAADVEAAVTAGALPSQPVSRARPRSGIPAQGRGSKGDAAASEALSTRTDAAAEPPAPVAPMEEGELRAALEAILLVVDEPVGELQLAQIVEQPAERVARVLEDISARYTAAGHGFDLRRAAGGWRLYTRPEYAAYVERFVLDGQSVRLTQAALETLAVVAYKQPVTRSRISAIRGVNCDGVMRTLNTRGLIEECGTEGETGAFLYRTTALFLEKLGLNSVDQLPPLAPFLPDDVEEVLDASG